MRAQCGERKVGFGELALFLYLLSESSSAYAQSVNTASPSSGTLVATVFETVGYKAQSMVLGQLGGFLGNLALAIWIICAVLALGLFLFSQKWSQALWLLIGPSLFYFAVFTPTLASRVEWRFGDYKPKELPRQQLVDEPGPFQVSWLFHVANRFISNSFAELTKVLTSGESEWIMKSFMTRQEVMNMLLGHRPEDGGLLSFSREVLAGCNKELDASRAVAAGYRDVQYRNTAEYKQAQKYLSTPANLRPPFAIQTERSTEFVLQLLSSPLQTGGLPIQHKCLDETRAAMSQYGLNPGNLAPNSRQLREFVQAPHQCERLWCWMGLGFQSAVVDSLDQEQATRGLDKATYDRIKLDLAAKLTNLDYVADASDPSGQTPLNGKLPIQPDVSMIPVVIGGYLIRETMRELDLHNPALAHFGAESGLELPPYQRDQNYGQDMAQFATQVSLQYRMSQSSQSFSFICANIIPYLQGVLLYALAVAYPFFGLLLLSLDKAKTFLTYFLLWAWVKSWDLGFAFVMLIDKVLWEFTPHSGFYDPQLDPNHGPVSVFASAFEGDPSFGIGTYYVIIGTCLTAVPIITAQVFVASYTSVLSHLFQGLKSFSQQIGNGANANTGIRLAVMFDSLRENSLEQAVMAKGDIDRPENLASPEVQNAYNGILKELDSIYNKLGEKLIPGATDAQMTRQEFDSLFAQTGQEVFSAQSGEFRGLATDRFSVARARLAVGRMRSNVRTAIFRTNASHNYFQVYLSSPQYAYYNGLRTTATDRREHWNLAAAPVTADQELRLSVLSQWNELQKMVTTLPRLESQKAIKP